MPIRCARHTTKILPDFMNKNKLLQIHEDSANGLIRPSQAAVLLTSVCQYALELEAKVEILQKQTQPQKSES